MKHISRYILTLVALFAMTTGAWADELTVFDGTSYVTLPFDKSYLYCYQKSEMLFPAEGLTAMKGQNITAIQFHTEQESFDFHGASFKVFLKEVSTYGFNTEGTNILFYGLDNATTVYEGAFSVADYKLTITFNTPYAYNGGILLVGVYFPDPIAIGDMNTSLLRFYGYNRGTTLSGLRNEGSESLDAITKGKDCQYLPKTTFTYSCVEMNEAKTEASFTMPAYDATVDYVLARDLEDADDPVEFSGIGEKLVVKKNGEKYEPVTTPTIQLIDKISGGDGVDIIADQGLTVKVLKGSGTPIAYDETNTQTLDAFLADAQPGFYKIVAEPADENSPYIGTVSLELEALAGYPVEIPAGGYITYYSDEALTVEENSGAKLYTITSVSGNTATATEIPSANAGMPFIIFNSTGETKTFLLIPIDDQIDQTVYPGFKGTLEGKTFTDAEMAATDHYVINKLKFVWVKDAGTIAAHRCWLEQAKNSAARSITIVFGEATSLKAIDNGQLTIDNETIYDLQGRKRSNGQIPNGLYILNGKKVVVGDKK